jgi:signal transduction histidine kinase
VEIALYRVCQESLNNVAKHARARKVRLDLRRTPKQLTLSVRDDGVGFAEERWRATLASPSGFGLLGMRERIADLGGHFEVVSRPGKGTDVRVRLPLVEAEEDR